MAFFRKDGTVSGTVLEPVIPKRSVLVRAPYSGYDLDIALDQVIKKAGLDKDAQKLIEVLENSPGYKECVIQKRQADLKALEEQTEKARLSLLEAKEF